ncbi:MAG TPA: hypothetical protein VKE51_32330 [Vicinamibacterales bacterium]|nr:hypothetical protein [Vicinamibacterales bacterium]
MRATLVESGSGSIAGAARSWPRRLLVVTEAFVKRYSRDQGVVGRQIEAGGAARTVLGVVGDIQQKTGFGNLGPLAPAPATYSPAAQTASAPLAVLHTWFSPSWLVRLRGGQQGAAAEMQRAMASVDPLLPFAKSGPSTSCAAKRWRPSWRRRCC